MTLSTNKVRLIIITVRGDHYAKKAHVFWLEGLDKLYSANKVMCVSCFGDPLHVNIDIMSLRLEVCW